MRSGQQLEKFATTFGIAASAALHLIAFAYLTSATTHFDFDFELTLPTEVEFGVAEGMELASPGAEPAPVPEAAPESDPSPDPDPDPAPDPKPDPVPEPEPELVSAPTLEGPSRLPPGAHLALRIDMKRIRESPLGPDVTRFLRGVPDWQLILEGSGIDPVDDLDRLMVATPNLRRSRLVLAGRHRRDATFARKSVTRLARSNGRSVRWQQRFGVPTAAWHDRDPTRRTIALLGTHHFSITRREDLARVLALAKARELRSPEEEGVVAARGPEALLSMGPEEALSLEIEGVHRFIIGSVKYVPTRLRIAVRETAPNEVTVSALATYEAPALAEQASAYWKKVATFYSGQLVFTLAGFGKTLRGVELQPDEDRVSVRFTLNADQIRFLLSYAEGRLQGSGGFSQPRRRR